MSRRLVFTQKVLAIIIYSNMNNTPNVHAYASLHNVQFILFCLVVGREYIYIYVAQYARPQNQ